MAMRLVGAIVLFSIVGHQLVGGVLPEYCTSEKKAEGRNCIDETRSATTVNFFGGAKYQWSLDADESLSRTGFYFDWRVVSKEGEKKCPSVNATIVTAIDRNGAKMRSCRARIINPENKKSTYIVFFPRCVEAYATKAPGLFRGKARIHFRIESDSPRQPHCQHELTFDRPFFDLAPDQLLVEEQCGPGENCISAYGDHSINVTYHGGYFLFRVDVPVVKSNEGESLRFLWAVRPKCKPQSSCSAMEYGAKKWNSELETAPPNVLSAVDIDGRRSKAQKAEARVIVYNCSRGVVPGVNEQRATVDFELNSDSSFNCPNYLIFPYVDGTDYDYRFPGVNELGVNCIHPNLDDSIVVKFYGGHLDWALELPAEAKSSGFNITWKKPLSFVGESTCSDQSVKLIAKDANGKNGCSGGMLVELPDLGSNGDEETRTINVEKCLSAVLTSGPGTSGLKPGRARINLRLESNGPRRSECPNEFAFAYDDDFTLPSGQAVARCWP